MVSSTHLAFVCLLTLLPAALLAKEVPPGLRPAKAVDDPEKPIVPKLEQQQGQQQLEEASIVPTQSNGLAAAEEQEEAQREGKTEEPMVEQPAETSSEKKDNAEAKIMAGDKPLIFQKNGKNKRRLTPAVPGSGTQVVQQVIKAPVSEPEEGTTVKPNVRTIPPPVGKDYGVNTLLQTNLVDSKGRVLKGVSAVPIVVPDIRNPKASRASASRVESEAEKAVRINFSG